jgi:hypothetical protein
MREEKTTDIEHRRWWWWELDEVSLRKWYLRFLNR